MNLSKSLYTRGLQCTKSLWLKKYKPTVLAEPDDFVKAIFETGNKIGDLACTLFPNGKEIPYNGTSFEEKIELTQKWLDEGIDNIYEATFKYDDILVMIDILHRNSDGSFEIYEVKSSSWNDKKGLKDIEKYIHDASIQYYVLSGMGYDVSKVCITMIDSSYVFQDVLDVEKLFVHIDVTEQILELQNVIPSHLKTFQSVLSQTEEEPNVTIGQHCFKPYKCDAYDYCWRVQNQIPEYSVFNIFNMGKKPLELFEDGIIEIEQIPNDALTTENQKLAVDAWVNKATLIDKDAIGSFINSLQYPIYHLDFETYMDTVPVFNNQRPFQQICFQYSLHIESEDGGLDHKQFLAESGSDPRESFIISMLDHIPSNVCILVYNESFEKTRIKELAQDFPVYADKLMNLHDNIIDLAEPFRKKHYYDYNLKGKFSIKLVMPLLAPHMANAYKKLQLVQNGGDAMNTFPRLVNMEEDERQQYRAALLEYCKLDTLSMVEVLKKLKESTR